MGVLLGIDASSPKFKNEQSQTSVVPDIELRGVEGHVVPSIDFPSYILRQED